MIRLFANANYDFIGLRKIAYGLTAAIIIPGWIMLAVSGLTYSVEFTGGTVVQLRMHKRVTAADMRSALDRGGVRGAEIQAFGSDSDFIVRTRLEGAQENAATEAAAQQAAARVEAALTQSFGQGAWRQDGRQAIGPKGGGELRPKALIAVLLSFLATLVYLAFRFEFRFGVAATVATAHDIFTTIAFIKYMNLEISLVVVAAILTVVGYSLNDTIIIFDRVRENLRKYKRDHFADILNRSINETLPRSILTHGTTIATTVALLIFAGEVIRPFAWVMAFGIFTGTFSSIYIASPILLYIEQKWPGREARGVKAQVQAAGHHTTANV